MTTTLTTDPTTDPTAVRQLLLAAGVQHALAPGDPDFAAELRGFNTLDEHRPLAVVAARSAADVATAVGVAARLDLPVTVLGHGHGVLGPIVGGVTVTTRGLASGDAGVEVDAAERTARVVAGSTWADVLDAATPYGLAPLCGSAPHVGVIGYLLGGGLGPVARTYGFAADHVRSLEVVTADGRLLLCDAEHEPDLFWALRGGKGGLALVVAATIHLFPLAEIEGGGLYWSAEHAAPVLRAFSAWSAGLPEHVSTSIALLRLPPIPELPEVLRGRFVVHVRVAVVGDGAETARLLGPLLAVAEPLLDTVTTLPYAAIGSIHADPVEPMPGVEGGLLLRGFDAEAVAAVLAVAGPDVPAPLALVEVRLLGGAVSRQPTVPNAVGGRSAAYSLFVVGLPVPELLEQVVPAAVRGVFAALAPWELKGAGSAQINFFGNANEPAAIRGCWPTDVAERLDAVRDAYDPEHRFPFPGRV